MVVDMEKKNSCFCVSQRIENKDKWLFCGLLPPCVRGDLHKVDPFLRLWSLELSWASPGCYLEAQFTMNGEMSYP